MFWETPCDSLGLLGIPGLSARLLDSQASVLGVLSTPCLSTALLDRQACSPRIPPWAQSCRLSWDSWPIVDSQLDSLPLPVLLQLLDSQLDSWALLDSQLESCAFLDSQVDSWAFLDSRRDSWAASRDCSEIVLGLSGDSSGVVLGLFWDCSGVVLGLFWACSGVALCFSSRVLGSFWDCSGTVLELCRPPLLRLLASAIALQQRPAPQQ